MTASKIIGREAEQRRLIEAFRSGDPELVALYGRRRVGKTFLIRELFRDSMAFELTGLHQESMKRQLESFANSLRCHYSQRPLFDSVLLVGGVRESTHSDFRSTYKTEPKAGPILR